MNIDETFTSDGRLIESTQHNGDGTGTRTVFDADGNVTLTEALTDLPIPEPPAPTAEEELTALKAQMAALIARFEGETDGN